MRRVRRWRREAAIERAAKSIANVGAFLLCGVVLTMPMWMVLLGII
jgi:hypothetical protein